jgi:hypothetical protein
MDQEHAPEHQWPDDEQVRDERPEAPRSRRERIVRALGDVFLTAGMGRGVGGGGRDAADVRATSSVILFGEGEAKGREANRGSGSERR